MEGLGLKNSPSAKLVQIENVKREIEDVQKEIKELKNKIKDFDAGNSPKDDFSKQRYLHWQNKILVLSETENLLLATTPALQHQGKWFHDISFFDNVNETWELGTIQ